MKYGKLLGAAAALSMLAGTLPASAEEVVLRYSNWVPATHPIITKVIEPLSRDLEEATEGRVTIEVLPALGLPPGHFDLVENEVADMAFSVHGYTPGRFTLTEIGELPFTHTDDVEKPLSLSTGYFLDLGGTWRHAATILA